MEPEDRYPEEAAEAAWAAQEEEPPRRCSCRTGYANSPGIHNNQVRLYGSCACDCHRRRR